MSKIDKNSRKDFTLSLAIIDSDTLSVKDIVRELEVYNINTSHYAELKGVITAINRTTSSIPDILLIDQESENAFEQLPDFHKAVEGKLKPNQKRPLIIGYSDDQSLNAKLVAAKVKIDAVLEKPLKCNHLVEKLDEMIFAHNEEPLRIMVVDDTPAACSAIATTLEDAGMNTLVVLDPIHAFGMLEVFQPDLVLIDLYMPEINGTELVRAIRYYPKFNSLALVFFSNEEDITKQLDALQCGADDFLTKSLPAPTLAVSVEAKAKRSRYFRSLMIKDSLTGLFNYSYCFDRLYHRMERAQRNNYPLAVAFLVVDNFKNINDKYGHSVGDSILRVIAHILQHRLRKSDIVGRNIGVGFFLIMPDTTEQAAFAVLDNLRENFSRVKHEYRLDYSMTDQMNESGSFKTTFSAGIACFPKYKSVDELLTAAEDAFVKGGGDKGDATNKVTLS